MSWDLLKRFIESDVFNQNPFLSVAYLSYDASLPMKINPKANSLLLVVMQIMLAFITSFAPSFDNSVTKKSSSFCPSYVTLS
jgi:hypothetical protein